MCEHHRIKFYLHAISSIIYHIISDNCPLESRGTFPGFIPRHSRLSCNIEGPTLKPYDMSSHPGRPIADMSSHPGRPIAAWHRPQNGQGGVETLTRRTLPNDIFSSAPFATIFSPMFKHIVCNTFSIVGVNLFPIWTRTPSTLSPLTLSIGTCMTRDLKGQSGVLCQHPMIS